MFSLALSMVLAAAAAAPDPVIPARKAYSACLNKVTIENLDKKTDASAFDGLLQGACAAPEAELKKALIASDLARGFKRKDAEEGAALQIDDYLAVAKEDYRGYQESKTKPN
ncbi:hypothetical protein IC614_05780 [Allosphingosinicella flava]|uniref:Uncharacterized protein n=1 Tax=Allosphingosinicella flava TaxID=2771430 RepID=A0A7T2LN74_9SPHN|nr:hypothetical protein [Sphingosinicella flava]QPQ56078.1 hypothetical protein IC614_05780 [Sphingosinicella flava]